jgi:hypothetical protein
VAFLSSYFVPKFVAAADTNVLGEGDSDVFVGNHT